MNRSARAAVQDRLRSSCVGVGPNRFITHQSIQSLHHIHVLTSLPRAGRRPPSRAGRGWGCAATQRACPSCRRRATFLIMLTLVVVVVVVANCRLVDCWPVWWVAAAAALLQCRYCGGTSRHLKMAMAAMVETEESGRAEEEAASASVCLCVYVCGERACKSINQSVPGASRAHFDRTLGVPLLSRQRVGDDPNDVRMVMRNTKRQVVCVMLWPAQSIHQSTHSHTHTPHTCQQSQQQPWQQPHKKDTAFSSSSSSSWPSFHRLRHCPTPRRSSLPRPLPPPPPPPTHQSSRRHHPCQQSGRFPSPDARRSASTHCRLLIPPSTRRRSRRCFSRQVSSQPRRRSGLRKARRSRL